MKNLPEITATGRPRDLGRQHGEQAAPLIRSAYATRMRRACRDRDEAAVLQLAAAYLPYVEKYTPDLLEEVAGIAQGAGVTFEAAFFLQVATELELQAAAADTPVTDGCSSLGGVDPVVGPFIGQNWDQPIGTYDTQILLRLIPARGPAIMMFTRAGVVGYIGVNGAGVGYVNNQLYSSSPLGLTGYFITRKFLTFESAKSATSWLRDIEIGSCGNYLVGDASGTLVDVELGGGCVAEIPAPIQMHTNHYLRAPNGVKDGAIDRLPDSYSRYGRLCELFAGRGTCQAAVAALTDHEGYPKSTCRHENEPGLSTVASVLIHLRSKEMRICAGNPCTGAYTTYVLGS